MKTRIHNNMNIFIELVNDMSNSLRQTLRKDQRCKCSVRPCHHSRCGRSGPAPGLYFSPQPEPASPVFSLA